MRRPVPSVALLLMLAGCAAAPVKNSTVAPQEAAIEANRRGEAYVRHGELENAARSYREALRLSQSLEDPDGIAANAINLSIVRQRQGRFADARSSLGAVLEQPHLRFAPLKLAEVCLRHALLDFDEGRFAQAEKWLSRSDQYCGERCPLSEDLHNTIEQLALQAGGLDDGAAAARGGRLRPGPLCGAGLVHVFFRRVRRGKRLNAG